MPNNTYANMLHMLDSGCANVSDALTQQGMWSNTLMLFTADNGGIGGVGNNYPLRGGKYSFYEGGINVVGMLKWPAALGGRAGAVYDGLLGDDDLHAVHLLWALQALLLARLAATSPA